MAVSVPLVVARANIHPTYKSACDHLVRHTCVMNKAFYVDELVRRIGFHADGRSLGSASLLALACCCKALEGPVMDVLWKRQKYLSVILQTLPADCWTVTNRVYVSGLWLASSSFVSLIPSLFPQHLVRAPTKEEWERFKLYTGRVVELHVGRIYSGEVSSETISFLGMQSTVDPLWPRLTSLKLLNRPGWNSVPPTLSFLSPKMKTLALILPRDASILLQPILSIASDRCRWLQELILDIATDDSRSASWIGGLIAASRDTLRTLEINSPFHVECLPIIANLPRLRSLHLERVNFSEDLPPGAFPVLEEFTFLHFLGRRVQHFLKHLGTTDLKVAKIYSTDLISFEKAMVGLSRFSTSLTSLEITAITGVHLLRIPISRHPFVNLRHLRLRCFRWGDVAHATCGFRPSDEAIAVLGGAMPNLTHLTLGSPTCSTLQCVTFLSLVSLSKSCKGLETLEIKVDFQSMVVPSTTGGEGTGTDAMIYRPPSSACKLRKLFVGLSIVPQNPESGWMVAIGLGKIFPSLVEVEGCGLERSEWDKVCENIRMSRQVLRTVGK